MNIFSKPLQIIVNLYGNLRLFPNISPVVAVRTTSVNVKIQMCIVITMAPIIHSLSMGDRYIAALRVNLYNDGQLPVHV